MNAGGNRPTRLREVVSREAPALIRDSRTHTTEQDWSN